MPHIPACSALSLGLLVSRAGRLIQCTHTPFLKYSFKAERDAVFPANTVNKVMAMINVGEHIVKSAAHVEDDLRQKQLFANFRVFPLLGHVTAIYRRIVYSRSIYDRTKQCRADLCSGRKNVLDL